MMLQQRGHEVIVVDDGKKAVEACREHFDVVLMDIQMPEMDGFEALVSSVLETEPNAVAGPRPSSPSPPTP